jgi:hypothetical protein
MCILDVVEYPLNLPGQLLNVHVMQELHKKRLQLMEKAKCKRKSKGASLSCATLILRGCETDHSAFLHGIFL